MRTLGDLLDVPHRTLGRERRIRRCRGNGMWRPRNTENRNCAESKQAGGDTDSFEHRKAIRSVVEWGGGAKVNRLTAYNRGSLLVDRPVLHHELNVANRGDVSGGIAIHCDQVGQKT